MMVERLVLKKANTPIQLIWTAALNRNRREFSKGQTLVVIESILFNRTTVLGCNVREEQGRAMT